jgi:hypothetical protein
MMVPVATAQEGWVGFAVGAGGITVAVMIIEVEYTQLFASFTSIVYDPAARLV